MNIRKLLHSKVEVILFLLFAGFSILLMFKTFGITADGNIKIASKAWSDFAATIPLIRSFSFGYNFPPEYPIFAGPPIRYHFIFFALVGLLEKTGIPLDWALNTLSTICFFLLLLIIYYFGKIVFNSKLVGFLSTILFIFNGSFGFVEFFKKNPLSINSFTEIINNTAFSSFGPYDGKIVSAFWNLNVYTNQRHLALAYSISLLLMLIIFLAVENQNKLTIKKSIMLGLFLAFLPFIHLSAFIMTGISLVIYLIIFPKLRLQIFTIGIIALVLAIPQYLYMGKAEVTTKLFHFGYLVNDLTIPNFIKYWFLNLGLTSILAPIGFILADKDQRKMLIPFFSFFIIGNIFQFTPDIPTNHKFINFFVIGLNFFSAYVLAKLWTAGKHIGKPIAVGLLTCLTFTGIIDIFPVFNDTFITIVDVPNNKIATFIKDNTPKNSTFLNAKFLYDPANIAGRKIFMGWPYFSWGAGYDTSARDVAFRSILNPESVEILCNELKLYKINYIEIENPTDLLDMNANYEFFETNMVSVYYSEESKLNIYDVEKSCKKI